MAVSRVAAYRMEPRLRVTLGSCGLALALGDLLFVAIFGASAVSDYRGEAPGFFRELAGGRCGSYCGARWFRTGILDQRSNQNRWK
jgi:hypothetical protein